MYLVYSIELADWEVAIPAIIIDGSFVDILGTVSKFRKTIIFYS